MSLSAVRQFLFDIISPNSKGYRPDIDGLRAVAVLAVVFYHYAPHHLRGGFIGVDVFFVISGYLITGILVRAFEAKSFGASLLNFYQHRVRRIFPALALILILCLVVGWLLLFSIEYTALGKHVAAGAGFIQNIILWREAGYFDAAAIQKPLLHLWSLAVEEQFYIFWPLILWFIMRKRWLLISAITAIAALSFAINIWGIWLDHATAAFYLPVARAWELMVGAWLAVGHHQGLPWLRRWTGSQSWLGLGLIAVGFICIRPGDGFPGFWALLPTLGTVLVINAGSASYVNRRLLSLRPAVWVGLISYPLYLWHWTLLSLTVMVFGDGLERSLLHKYKLVALALSFLLAWLTYRWVELPIRRHGRGRTTIALATTMLALGLGGLSIYAMNGVRHRAFTLVSTKAENYLASITRSPRAGECFDLTTGSTLPDRWSCTLGDLDAKTWVAAYGDSHALSFMPILNRYGKEKHVRIVFAGLSGCPPLMGIYPERATKLACEEISKRMAKLIKNRHAAAVVLVARWTYYTGGTTRPGELQPIKSLESTENPPHGPILHGIMALKNGLDATLAYYQSLHVPVVLVEDNAQQKVRLPKGIGRFDHKLTDGTFNSIAVTLSEHHDDQAEVNKALEAAAAQYPVTSILNTDSALCGSGICPWVSNGKFLYYDDDHLSITGSMRVYPLLENQLNNIFSLKRRE